MKVTLKTILGKCCTVLAAFFLPLMLAMPCLAAGEISLQVDDSDLAAGDEITVSANLLEGIDAYAITGTLQYDRSIFEVLDAADFETSETMSVSYNAVNQKFGIINQTGTVGQRLFSVRLRVREDANVGETNIAFSNITVSDGSNKSTYSTASTQVLVTRDAEDDETISTHAENAIVETSEGVQNVFSNLPFIIAGAIAVAIIVLVAILQFGNLTPNTSKLHYRLIGLGVVIAVLTVALAVVNNNKKDVNGDGAVDYGDAQEIIDYLIGIEGNGQTEADAEAEGEIITMDVSGGAGASTGANDGANAGENAGTSTAPQRRPEDYDVNNDGKVDENDAGHQAENAQKETKVSLSDSKLQDSYVEKRHNALIFAANVQPAGVTIKRAKVNGVYYDVEPYNGDYIVHIEPLLEAQIYNLAISEVQTSNGRDVAVSYERNIEVLKSIPMVENFHHDQLTRTVSFDILDPDGTLTSAQADLYGDDLENALRKAVEVSVGDTNTIEIPAGNDLTYLLEVSGRYCRAQDTNNENFCETEPFFTHKFAMTENFDFAVDEFSVSDYVTEDAVPLMNFRSSNAKNLAVESVRVMINDNAAEDYPVELNEDGRYEVTMDHAEKTPGSHHYVKLEQVTLEDGTNFKNPEDFIVSNDLAYFVPHDLPTIHGLNLQNKADEKKIHVGFDLSDARKAVRKLTYLLVDGGDRVVVRRDVNYDDEDYAEILRSGLDLSYDGARDLAFTVKILADYDLGENHTFAEQELAEGYISAYKDERQLYIKQISSRDMSKGDSPETVYAEKGQKRFELLFQLYREPSLILKGRCVENYSLNSFTAFTVNGLNYSSYGLDKTWTDKSYNAGVFIGIPETAGVVDIEVSRVQFLTNGYNIQCSDWYTVPKKKYQIEVLKDKPQIANLKATENYDEKKVTFDFDVVVDASAKDGDESFERGILQLGDTQKTFTNRGHNQVTFEDGEVPLGELKELIFKATYDRDTDALNVVGSDQDANQFTDDVIYTSQYGMFDANKFEEVKIVNAQALTNSKGNYNDNLFEKNETIGLYFEIEGIPSDLVSVAPPVKVKFAGRDETFALEEVTEDDGTPIANDYAVFVPGYTDAGNWSLRISEITLYNGQMITLDEEHSGPIGFEVLKTMPKVADFKYLKENDGVKIKSILDDPDEALAQDTIKIRVEDELGKEIYNGAYNADLTIENNGTSHYYLTLTADYNLRSSSVKEGAYIAKGAELLSATLVLDDKYIELKNINDVNLYHVVSGVATAIEVIKPETLNAALDEYYVEIAFDSMPTMRTKISSIFVREKRLYLMLDSEYLTGASTYRALTQGMEIEFGEIDEEGMAHNDSHPIAAFTKLLELLSSGEGDVELTRDYDASTYSLPESGAYVDSFNNRTLNGNGHTIKNLKGALFGIVSKSEISNLFLDGVDIDDGGSKAEGKKSRGPLARRIDNSTKVSKVAAYNVSIRGGGNDPTGGLIGDAWGKSTIEECAVSGLSMNMGGVQQVGGLVGALGGGSSVKNSYVVGSISGTNGYKGGITGNSKNGGNVAKIENSYAKVSLGDNQDITGGIGTGLYGKFSFENVVSLSTGYRKSPMSNQDDDTIVNSYYVPLENRTFDDRDGLEKVEAKDINAKFFAEKVNFSDEVWRLDGSVSYDNPPRLQFERVADKNIEAAAEYDESKNNVYNNIELLAPYAEYNEIVKVGNQISDEKMLNKQIRLMVPLDDAGNTVTYVTTKDQDKIKKLKVVFTDGETEVYSAAYENTYDMVATYRIKALRADYNFPHYVINADARVIDNLTYYLRNMNYNTNLDALTTMDDSRTYSEFYDEVTSKELREFVLKFLANSDYTVTSNDAVLNSVLEREIKASGDLERTLYVYNYLHRFYNEDIKGMKLYDFMLFNMQTFNNYMTMKNVVDRFFADESAFDTANTNGGYVKVFENATGMEDLSVFLGYMVNEFGEGMTPAEWVRSQFKGILREVSVDDADLLYTLWDHFSTPDKYYGKQMLNFILPILTLPENASYIFSMPTHVIIGSQRTYLAKPDDPDYVKAFEIRVDAYAARYKTYFTTAWDILQDEDLFNNMHLYQKDKNWAYEDSGQSQKQRLGSTNDPHHKNFNELIRRFSGDGGINAGSYGNHIEWDVAGVMDSNLLEIVQDTKKLVPNYPDMSWSEATFGTFSHETLHNIDAKVFLRDNGRRWDAGGEDYADGNFRQEFSQTLIVMNLSKDWGTNCLYGANCSPESVNSQAKAKQFYGNAFDVIYTMDYLEALAFLQLEPKDMAELAVQVSYPNATGESFTGQLKTNFPDGLADDPKAQYRAYQTTKYTKMPASFYEELKKKGKLETVEDLYDNRIVIYPGVYKETSYGSNKYGSEGLGHVHWYQPHNNYGRPDSYSLKWLAYEFMGLKGWDEGYVEYYSNKVDEHIAYTYYTSFDQAGKLPFDDDDENVPKEQRLPTATTTVKEGEYPSNYYKNDEMAFSNIIENYDSWKGGDYEDGFEKYKKDRFKQIENKLQNLNSKINVKEYVNKLYTALLKDAEYQRVGVASKINGNEEGCLKDYWCVNGYAPYKMIGLNQFLGMRFSTLVRVEFYQILKRASSDFTLGGVIYQPTKQQTVNVDELKVMMKGKKLPEELKLPTSPYTYDEFPSVMIGEDGELIDPQDKFARQLERGEMESENANTDKTDNPDTDPDGGGREGGDFESEDKDDEDEDGSGDA